MKGMIKHNKIIVNVEDINDSTVGSITLTLSTGILLKAILIVAKATK